MSTYELVAKHVEAALAEAGPKGIADDVVARCLLSEAVRLFKRSRSNDDIASELAGLADNLDDDATYAFIRP